MAISDEVFIIAIGMIFTYLMVYRNHKLLGGMIFVALSIGISYYMTTNIGDLIGLLMLLGSIGVIVYDLLNIKVPSNGKGMLARILK